MQLNLTIQNITICFKSKLQKYIINCLWQNIAIENWKCLFRTYLVTQSFFSRASLEISEMNFIMFYIIFYFVLYHTTLSRNISLFPKKLTTHIEKSIDENEKSWNKKFQMEELLSDTIFTEKLFVPNGIKIIEYVF